MSNWLSDDETAVGQGPEVSVAQLLSRGERQCKLQGPTQNGKVGSWFKD